MAHQAIPTTPANVNKLPAFRYINKDGKNLSLEEISEKVDEVMDIALGIHDVCELALAKPEKVYYDGESLLRVINAAIEKAMVVGHQLFCDQEASEAEGEVRS